MQKFHWRVAGAAVGVKVSCGVKPAVWCSQLQGIHLLWWLGDYKWQLHFPTRNARVFDFQTKYVKYTHAASH